MPEMKPDPVPTTEDPKRMVGIVVTAGHVFIHLDEDGNGRLDWDTTSEETTRVEKRARLRVPHDLAKFLAGKRDQVEIL